MKKKLVASLILLAALHGVVFAQDPVVEFPQMPEETNLPPPMQGCPDATCNPASDILCWNWCDVKPYSLADVYHWDGTKWKTNWEACGVNLKQWIAYAESLQRQIRKCKKWGK